MQVLSPRVIRALNNLPGFPPRPRNTTVTPQAGQFILGTYLEEIRVRPGVFSIPQLPLYGNSLGDVRIVIEEQAWYLWDGVTWVAITGGSGGVSPSITGQATGTLTAGQVGYLVGANAWGPASADGVLSEAQSLGVYAGDTGTILLSGSTIPALQCTTDGGTPAINGRLYLAPSAQDGGTAAGKVTATPPEPPVGGTINLQYIGVCVDNTNYAVAKTVKAIFQPAYPVILVG